MIIGIFNVKKIIFKNFWYEFLLMKSKGRIESMMNIELVIQIIEISNLNPSMKEKKVLTKVA